MEQLEQTILKIKSEVKIINITVNIQTVIYLYNVISSLINDPKHSPYVRKLLPHNDEVRISHLINN